ncbi:3-isopropylmalate dehydratase large subunit [Gemmobacter nectariphilus]|uniref:3-isopropylmalate dehydratase large subunit n=1 Tax=Gemmobacter nectariphilus TaxID=220343 RepID=UPI00040D6883|nr:3-isopropylmalate dehydratase large subunit [Gemmobacter nectariphilus]
MSAPATLAQKLVARAARKPSVRPGEIVTVNVDLAMIHDSGGPRRVAPMLKEIGREIWDPARVALVLDHFIPADTDATRAIVETARTFAVERRIGQVFDSVGICHAVLPERGLLKPGMFVVGGDSHSPTGGAFGAYMFGVGATDMAGVLASGQTWLTVPETILMQFDGTLAPGVSAKDIMLFLCGRFGMGGGRSQAVEYTGSAIAALPMQERMTLANMTAELGGQAGLIAADDTTVAHIRAHGGEVPDDWANWRTDPGAEVSEHHVFDASALPPQVAAPHSPANSAPIDTHAGTPLDLAYIGACTGAKLADMRMAASVMRGHRIADGLRLLLAPATLRDQQEAAADGTLDTLIAAGAELLPNACGICAGYGSARLGENVRAISTTARNFRGRMGADSAQVWLASPYTVAASAIAGRITDPRPMLKGGAA